MMKASESIIPYETVDNTDSDQPARPGKGSHSDR